jgi:Uma2 family endonuclease
MKTVSRATIDDLYRVPENGKAELVGGQIVRMSPTGGLPGRASAAIYASLRRHEKTTGGGLAYPDNTGFVVELPQRKSFSPDAAFHPGTTPTMGTLVVWDVDLVGADVVRVFRAASAEPSIYRRGDVAEAEPAVPGWRMKVDELFE